MVLVIDMKMGQSVSTRNAVGQTSIRKKEKAILHIHVQKADEKTDKFVFSVASDGPHKWVLHDTNVFTKFHGSLSCLVDYIDDRILTDENMYFVTTSIGITSSVCTRTQMINLLLKTLAYVECIQDWTAQSNVSPVL